MGKVKIANHSLPNREVESLCTLLGKGQGQSRDCQILELTLNNPLCLFALL